MIPFKKKGICSADIKMGQPIYLIIFFRYGLFDPPHFLHETFFSIFITKQDIEEIRTHGIIIKKDL